MLSGNSTLYNLNTVLNELKPLHRHPAVMLNEQGSSHFIGRMFATWNIGKSMEVVDTMIQRRTNIMCLQKPNGWDVRGKNGMGITVDKEWKESKTIDHLKSQVGNLPWARIRSLFQTPTVGFIKHSIGTPSPSSSQGYHQYNQCSLTTSRSKALAKNKLRIFGAVGSREQKILLGWNLNGNVDGDTRQFIGAHSTFGFGELNDEGQSILDSSVAYNFKITNTCFKKPEEHLITYKWKLKVTN
ncbi:hypothetical protein CR513_33024, partial [Mucuna pruriens]